MSLNKVTLSGNLGADAELRYTRARTAVATFPLAVSERTKGADGEWSDYTNWVDCAVFGRRAEGLAPWLRKGDKVSLTGRLHTSTFEDREGRKVKRYEVRVEDVELMAQRKRSDPGPEAPNAAPGSGSSPDLYDEDLPF